LVSNGSSTAPELRTTHATTALCFSKGLDISPALMSIVGAAGTESLSQLLKRLTHKREEEDEQ
jgi:hypothetical protein